MPYLVEHVRFTLECDACGRTEKRDMDASREKYGLVGWSDVRTSVYGFRFCCPDCAGLVNQILSKRDRETLEASAHQQANCAHEYVQRGLLAQCTKCEKFKP
jgi:hypothetical protein